MMLCIRDLYRNGKELVVDLIFYILNVNQNFT
jgi:hypothetical protein